jgi:outer membrane receptor protein involved in Fe transport
MRTAKRISALWFAASVSLTARAASESAVPLDSSASLEQVVVVGTTPLAGSDVERDRLPAATQVLGTGDINRTGIPSLTGAILSNLPSATINDVEGNVFQPDILFRGFTASPVAGTPQGLAVYVNGARFNDAFGDTVNWDLIPPTAIKTVAIEASNPVFGLNALGGSISVQLKNGFTDDQTSVSGFGGSYGRRAGIGEFSRQMGAFAVYLTGDVTHDGGFRQTSASDLYRGYADVGWRDGPAEAHLNIMGAHDRLGNPGATPVQALATDLSNIFTAPNIVDNKYVALNLNATDKLTETTSLQGLAYFHNLRQYVPNGITEELQPCGFGGLLCNSDGSVVTTTGGQSVTDFLNGGTYSGLSVQQLQSHAYGATVQLTDQSPLGGNLNHLVAGLSFDGSQSIFSGVQEIGGFDPYTREFLGPGVIQDQPDEGVNPVRVRSITRFYGAFVSEVLPVSKDIDVTLSGRFNDAQVVLEDQLGGPVNGAHTFNRFNPSAGLAYRITPGLQLYGNYSETNRAPTPQELSCASAAYPCSLLNFFVGDPNLNQVVARTVEIGARGQIDGGSTGQVAWDVDVYHTQNTDDIIYESTVSNPNLAFYTNAGRTLRQGVEANLRYEWRELRVKLGYAFTDATFRTPLDLNSGSNPAADDNGQIQVMPGDRIPGIPRHRATLLADYAVTTTFSIGGEAMTQSSAYRFGDESNLTAPVAGYTVVDVHASLQPIEHLTLFAVVNNVFDRRYFTYGSFGPVGDVPWPNVPGGVSDPRTASPGMPIAAYGGIRLEF